MLDPWTIAVAAAAFFIAGLVKGVTGMGLPPVAMGVLGALVSPLTAASLLILPSFVTNIWQLFAGPSVAQLTGRLWPMMLGIAPGTLAGTSVLASGDTALSTAALVAALAGYSAFTLFSRQPSVPPSLERRLSPWIGATTGLVADGTGIFSIPAVPFLQALGLDKDDLVQALGLTFTVATVALAAGLTWHGALRIDQLALSAAAVAPALGGMWVGQFLRGMVAPQRSAAGS